MKKRYYILAGLLVVFVAIVMVALYSRHKEEELQKEKDYFNSMQNTTTEIASAEPGTVADTTSEDVVEEPETVPNLEWIPEPDTEPLPDLKRDASSDGYYLRAVDFFEPGDNIDFDATDCNLLGETYFDNYINWYLDGDTYSIACEYTVQGNEEYIMITTGNFGLCFEHLADKDYIVVSGELLSSLY